MDLEFRSLAANEEAFIFSSWLKSYKHSSLFAKRITNDIYYLYHHLIIERILASPNTGIVVAVSKAAPETVLGYCVITYLDCPTIHFLYVKAPFRRLGIGKAILSHLNANYGGFKRVQFTHWTKSTESLLAKLEGVEAVYNPYVI